MHNVKEVPVYGMRKHMVEGVKILKVYTNIITV